MANGMYVLCEIDNVLANTKHRQTEIQAERVRLTAGDHPVYPTCRMLKGFERSGAEIVLVSFIRSQKDELEVTRKWLRNAGVKYDWLILVGADSDKYKSLSAFLKENEEGNILVGAIGTTKTFLDYVSTHPHKPVIYEVRSCSR